MAAVLFTALFLLVTGTFADVEIKLRPHNGSKSVNLHDYSDYKPFRRQYANTGSRVLNGTLHQPVPNYNACLPVQNVTIGRDRYHKWFLLVDDYPSCSMETMIKYVKESNYSLVIASSQRDTHHSISDNEAKQLKLKGLGMVIISEKYADYLKHHALTDPNNFNLNSSIIVFVNTSNGTTEMLIFWVAVATGIILFVLFCLMLRWKCVSKRRQNGPPETDIEGVDRSRHGSTARRQQIRSQLINSYFQRQLMHTNAQFHSPLGEKQIKKLPIRQYRASKGAGRSSCAICVDEFVNGALVRVLSCGHTFHSECIDKWFIRYSSLCPLCKRDVSTQLKSPVTRTQDEMDSTSSDNFNDNPQRKNNGTPVNLHQYGSIS